MNKKTYFYIDDVIWPFRDVTRERPESLFDNLFLGMLKKAHDEYGMKVQLNVFYRTDFFYGHDEFTLAEMTDAYKSEWEGASDWLKLGFHSKQEFPDYPYVNADYDDVKGDIEDIKREIFRFAGEKSFAKAVVPHWMPISKDGCRALVDSGIKMTSVSVGERIPYDGDPGVLPYGHAARLMHKRKPETMLYTRDNGGEDIASSICAYNHMTEEFVAPMRNNRGYYKDEETGMIFKEFCNGPCVNLYEVDELEAVYAPLLDCEYVGWGIHEQYFYPHYFNYQPDYTEKVIKSIQILKENGFEFFFIEEFV